MKQTIAIAVGGALGALSRFWLGSAIQRQVIGLQFPLGTFVVNIVGAFALGLTLAALPNRSIWSAAIATGFLGSFTTFSTFSSETVALLRDGFVATGVLYLIASVVVAAIGVIVGSWIGSRI